MIASCGCWLWLASENKGYGQIGMRKGERPIEAHRASWLIHRGEIPDGLFVCHRCDVPACVNPDHLFLGSNTDNRRDSVEKQRHAHGESQGPAKLTDQAVRAIRADTRSQSQIAKDYGVSQALICKVKRRKIWTHV